MMRTFVVLIVSVMLLSASACVPSQYTKSVIVKKDPQGKVVEILETETVSQRGEGCAINFVYLQGIQNPYNNSTKGMC
jgi:hypothetical protein